MSYHLPLCARVEALSPHNNPGWAVEVLHPPVVDDQLGRAGQGCGEGEDGEGQDHLHGGDGMRGLEGGLEVMIWRLWL